MATPQVAGVAALSVAGEGERTTAQLRRAIAAVDVGPAGDDGYTGQGRLRALKTVGIETNAPPSVDVVAPGDGATASGVVEVRVDVSDPDDPPADLTVNVTVAGDHIEARYDAADGRYEADWNTTTAAEDATATVAATVTDPDGASASAAVEVTVDNRNAPPSVRIERPANGSLLDGPTRVSVHASDPESPPEDIAVGVRAVGPETVTLNAIREDGGRFATTLNASAVPAGDYRLEATATDPAGASATATRTVTAGPVARVSGVGVAVPERFPYDRAVPVRVEVGIESAGGENMTAPVTVTISASVPIDPNGPRSVTVTRELRTGERTELTRRLVTNRSRNATVTVSVRTDAGGPAVERTRSVRPVAGDVVLSTLDGRRVADLDRDGTVDDLTGDDRVTLADAVVLDATNVSGLDPAERAALDHTGDGVVSRADAHRLAERAGAGDALPSDPDGDGLYEDVDGDGQFSVLDVAWLLEAFDGDGAWVTTVPERADANGDGRLDVLDVAALLEEL
jgi:hypothetical protein